MSETTLERKVRERREKEEQAAAEKLKGAILDDDAPDADLVPKDVHELSEEDKAMDTWFDSLDIFDAYDKLNIKGFTVNRKYTGSEPKVRCPFPDDPDVHPSASINPHTKTFTCHGVCAPKGGGIIMLGAIKYGYPEKPTGSDFHEVRRRIAEEFGWKFYTTPGSKELTMVPPDPEESAPATAQATVTPLAAAPSAKLKDPDDIDYSLIREIKWKEVIPADTFLFDYMLETTNDSAPEMFHFWNGMLALGLAVGRSAALKDQKPVYSNLFVCLMGRSGMGKSNSRGHLIETLRQALPYDPTDMLSLGVKIMRGAASGETLIDEFSNPEYDPTNPKRVLCYREIRGLMYYGELTGLIGRAERGGQSLLKDTVMELLDAEPVLGTKSQTRGRIIAENAFGSLWTSSQPKVIKDLLKVADQNSGFANRLKLIYGTPKDGDILDETVIDLTHPVAQLKVVHNWSGVVKANRDGLIRSTPAFKAALREAWFGKYKAFRDKSSKTDDMLGRLDLDFKRLCLLFAINEKRFELDADVVSRVTPVLDYLIDCSNLAGEAIGETVESELFTRILAIVDVFNQAKKTPTASEIHQKIKHNKNFTLKMVNDTLWQMENLGILVALVSTDSSKRGPKVKRFERGGRA